MTFLALNRRGRILRYAPLLFWVGVIFYMSSGQASMTETSRFIRPLLEFLFPNTAEETLTIYHGYIRKFAHFFEYALLALLSWWALRSSSIKFLQRFWYVFSFLFVVCVAAIDETNQSFDATRTGSIYDVLLDSFGGLSMILFLLLFTKKLQKKLLVNTAEQFDGHAE